MQKYYRKKDGSYYGSFDGLKPNSGLMLTEVPTPPPNAGQVWDNGKWVSPHKPEPTPEELSERVSDEAERLINAGTTISGVQFKTDDTTITRLEGLKRGFDRGVIGAEGRTYKTAEGDDVEFTSLAQVEAVLNAADDYRDFILSRSAELQNSVPIPDPYDDANWVA